MRETEREREGERERERERGREGGRERERERRHLIVSCPSFTDLEIEGNFWVCLKRFVALNNRLHREVHFRPLIYVARVHN